MIVSEIMSPEPYAANVANSISRVLEMLAEADVRHLPILENGALVGIVSDRDLRGVKATRATLAQPISTVMSSDVVSVQPDSDVADVIDLMIEHRIGAVPVVELNGAKLVGIVSYVDALRAARDLL